MMKNILKLRIFLFLACAFLFFLVPKVAEAGYNPNNIISDASFATYSTMSEQQIQEFLVSRNSYLKNYTETRSNLMGAPERYQAQGKSAAHIIWWVANEYKINPQVILVTLQKEQSLISNPNLDQYGIDFAMGYGCPDSTGCTSSSYPGFSRQVDWGSWQLKYNMVNANGAPYHDIDTGKFGGVDGLIRCIDVSPYCTGNTKNFDGTNVTFETGATASLYRYTPHIYWGNYNFYNFFTNWFDPYDYEFVSAINPQDTIGAGQTKSAQIVLKNTGVTSWYNDTQSPLTTPMRLYVYSGAELYPGDSTWESPARIRMTSNVVAPGQNGTFTFNVKGPMSPGFYSLKFFPIVENAKMLKDVGMHFDINVPDWHSMSFVSAVNPPDPVTPNSTVNVSIVLRNNGSALWQNDATNPTNPMRLAVVSGSDNLYEPTTWANSSKIKMTTASVQYGELAYFNFKLKFDGTSGKKIIKFAPVIEGVYQYPYEGLAFETVSFEQGKAHRFWSASRNAHFYTSNLTDFRYVVSHPEIWVYEGTSFTVSAGAGTGRAPVYRFWNEGRKVHFYTISEAEKQLVVNSMPEWKLEGVVYYLSPNAQAGFRPVYRFYNLSTGTHFYTVSEAEKNQVIATLSHAWNYEGIAFYAQ